MRDFFNPMGPPPQGSDQVADHVEATGDQLAGWPQKGPSDVQPWQLPDDERPPVSHSQPLLASGSAGPAVNELCSRLLTLGYETSFAVGENPFGVVDATVLAAVKQFRGDFGVDEDPSPFGGETDEGLRTASNHIGPWTWEAIIRASDRAGA
jgi:hypothetical protein